MKDWDVKRGPSLLPTVGASGDPAWEDYMSSCSDYLKRQIFIYQNWPQRKFSALGYSDEKVFTDMNA